MNEITITIDGRAIKTQEGEYILNAARANGIFIPAICYLTRCSPTLACRICLVEADGKQVYACNAKAKEGMDITTTTPNILAERRAIMEVYDVNHPLECGVCDQSGECELQNYTLEVGVDSQTYSIKDTHKPAQDWGLIHYDPALCIMCERCITVCKDMIGDAALSTVARGSDAIEAAFKETMPKDAYAMWNKLNKSLIAPNAGDKLDCTNCGECSAVCPVGALVSSDYQYTSNAWEHKQIPATCAHCSAGCQISYDIKHTSIADTEPKIYRVKNEWNYVSLCGAGRYGYDFENRNVSKDTVAFNKAVEAFKKADTIKFTSTITNEEALILQRLKDKFGYRLVNNEALAFKTFLSDYSAISGKSLYGGEALTTNNRMELRAVIEGLLALKRPCKITLYLDSQYVRQGITSWIHNWKTKGWKIAGNKPVKNADLWQQLDALVQTSPHRIQWEWVKGHAGIAGNEKADALANLGVEQVLAGGKMNSE